MADRTIVLATNGRHAVRGLTAVNGQEFKAYQEIDDNLTYVVDMSSYLDGDTISTVTRTANGPTVSNTSNTTTRLTQRLKGFGYVDFTIVTTGGDTEEFRITIEPRAGNAFFLTRTGSGPDNTAQFFGTTIEAAATSPGASVNYIWTSGNTVEADGYGGLWVYTFTQPAHTQYFTTANGRYYQRTTWGGSSSNRGGFKTASSIWPNGAIFWRFTDRLFLGTAVSADGEATAGGANTFLNDGTGLNSFYLERSAQLLSTSPWGGIGGTFASKTSLRYSYLGYGVWTSGEVVSAGAKRGYSGRLYSTVAGGTSGSTAPTHTTGSASDGGVTWVFDGYSYQVPIGVAGVADHDCLDGDAAWGIYNELNRRSGAGTGFAREIAVKNRGSNVTNHPYSSLPSGSSIGDWFAGGGDATLGSPANPSTAAIVIGKNATTWNKGIVFGNDAITGTDGSTGTGIALALAKGHVIQWFMTGGSVGASIYSDVSSAGARTTLSFNNDQVWFLARDAFVGLFSNQSGGTPVTYLRIDASASGSAPGLTAQGSDTDIDISLTPKGAGLVKYGTHTAKGAEAFSGYITIKDSGGTSRKVMVCS